MSDPKRVNICGTFGFLDDRRQGLMSGMRGPTAAAERVRPYGSGI